MMSDRNSLNQTSQIKHSSTVRKIWYKKTKDLEAKYNKNKNE